MAVQFTTTQELTEHFKVLVHGESGVGKTRLISTLPNPIIISSEKKAESLKRFNIPMSLVSSMKDIS